MRLAVLFTPIAIISEAATAAQKIGFKLHILGMLQLQITGDDATGGTTNKVCSGKGMLLKTCRKHPSRGDSTTGWVHANVHRPKSLFFCYVTDHFVTLTKFSLVAAFEPFTQ